LAKKPKPKVKSKKTGKEIAPGIDPVTGHFQKGNKLAVGGGPAHRDKRAREVFRDHNFDPLEARLAYHAELIAEAQKLKQDMVNGIYVDLTGTEHKCFVTDADLGVEVVDFDRVHYVRTRIDMLRDKADTIAGQLADYVHPKLKAIEISEGGDKTWAAIVSALADTKMHKATAEAAE